MKDEGTPTDATLPVDPTTMGAASSSVARTVGRFVVIDVLGQGAMGLVLAAYDPDLDRKVAVKLLRPDAYDASSREGRERMLREARALAKLSHPNVIAIHEVGTVADRIFLAMEFAPGGTLRSWLATEKRTWRDVLAKLVQAGRGLAAAHDAGLVHRDFKPTNVLLARNDEARVADFGLVGGSAEGSPGDARNAGESAELTHTGALLGTPAYMAPEQFEPEAGRAIGPAADQFAFCVSAWECLHGTRPFEGTTLATISENVCAHRVLDPPAGTDVPAWLRAVLQRGLATNPADRWPSMTALLAELARDPIAARARRVRMALVAVVVAGAFGAVAIVASRSSRTGPQCEAMERALVGVWDESRATAVREAFAKTGAPGATDTAERVAHVLTDYATAWVDARRTSCEATHVHGDQSPDLLDRKIACLDRHLLAVNALVDVLARADAAVVERALGAGLRLPSIVECTDAAALGVIAALPADPVRRGEIEQVRIQLASTKVLADTGQFKRAREKAAELVARASAVGYAPIVAEALYRRGQTERLDGDPKASLETFDAALLAATDAGDDRLFVELLSEKIYTLGDQLQRPAEAIALRGVAEAALRRAGSDRVTSANLIANIGRALMASNKYADAEQLLVKALALKEQVSGTDSFDVARAAVSLGNALYEQKRYTEALALHERASAIWRTTFGPNHPDVLMIENNVANIHFSNGNFTEARRRYEATLVAIEPVIGSDHPMIADLELNLGNTLKELELYDEAVARYHRAIAIKAAATGETNADVGQLYFSLGVLFNEIDRFTEAKAAFVKSIAIYDALDSEDLSYPLAGMSETLLGMKRPAEALPFIQRAAEIRETATLDEAERVYTRMWLGYVLLELGRERERAKALVEDARAFYIEQGPAGAKRAGIANEILAAHKR
ncbi:MAG: serine/threonine-protein kinase [Kofleriaceae bacterium]